MNGNFAYKYMPKMNVFEMLLDFGFFFYLNNLIVRIFHNFDVTMFAFIIIDVMPVTNRTIDPNHHVSASQTRHCHVSLEHFEILNSFVSWLAKLARTFRLFTF